MLFRPPAPEKLTPPRTVWGVVFTLALLFCLPLQASDPLQHRIDKLVERWRATLQLEDWVITAHAVRLADMPEGILAYSKWDGDLRRGFVAVLDPRDCHAIAVRDQSRELTGKQCRKDVEDSVVHELVHLRLKAITGLVPADEEQSYAAEELTTVRLTNALLRKK